MDVAIDITFDFRADTPSGRDPDAASPTLRRYHRILWSKPLPSGERIELAPAGRARDCYLTDLRGPESLRCYASDAITHTYSYWRRPGALVAAIATLDDAQRERYLDERYTIASAMVWPVRFADKPTINQARGTRTEIADRVDLTLECIRRHYLGLGSPLADVLGAYGDFFEQFGDVTEFASFFLLQDLLTDDGEVRLFLPLEGDDGFGRHGAPRSVQEYVDLQEASLAFIAARGRRIAAWQAGQRATREWSAP